MTREGLALLLVVLGGGVKRPDLEDVIAAAGDEAPVARGAGARVATGDAAGGEGGPPGDRVDAEAVGGEHDVVDGVVLELEDGDGAVRGGAGQEAARLVGGPGNDVDRGLVLGEVVDALPLRALLGALLLPDEDFAVVTSRRQDVAVLGMRPCHTPDRTFVAALYLPCQFSSLLIPLLYVVCAMTGVKVRVADK